MRRSRLTFAELETFVAVVEHESFVAAAEALELAPSTVTFHVKALETRLGSRLLDRGGRRVRPTASGRRLLGHARALLAGHDAAIQAVTNAERGDAGEVRVAASSIPADYVLPPVLAAFAAKHPASQVLVSVTDSDGALEALLAERCDLAVVGKRTTNPRLAFAKVADDDIVLVSRADRTEALPLPVIGREAGSGTWSAVVSRLPAVARTPGLVVGSTEAARRCVLAGLGSTFLSRVAVEEDLASSRLRLVALDGTPIRRALWLARRRGATPSVVAKAFAKALLDWRHRAVP